MKRIILFVFLFSLNVFAQSANGKEYVPHKSIHQIQWEEHFKEVGKHSIKDVIDKNIIPLQKRFEKTDTPQKAVFGFLPDWEYPDAMNNLQYDLVTHISAFDFNVSSDGTIGNPAGWPWTDLINTAHNNGVKVILTAVDFDASSIRTLLTDKAAKNNFFSNLKTKMDIYSLDGVNIDFEGLNTADRGALLNDFMAELTDSLHAANPGSEVSFDGPAVNWGGWDLSGLADACDYIFIMGYAFSGSWSDYTGATAPLTGGTYNVTNTLSGQYVSVTNSNPEKLILGVPYYGPSWVTSSSSAHTNVSSYIGAVLYSSAKNGFANNGTLWDNFSSSPWYRYQSDNNWVQVWCDNPTSIDAKFALADSKGLKGVGMWALNYDGTYNDFWNVLRDRYAPGTVLMPMEPFAAHVRTYDSTSLLVSFKEVENATSYRVYYGTDGVTFTDSADVDNNQPLIDGLQPKQLYFLKVCALNAAGKSSTTSLLAATTSRDSARILIVDGFDRQSGTTNSRDYIRFHAFTLYDQGLNFVSATNEAIINDAVNLTEFPIVDWMLGDESTVDDTFNPTEQDHVKLYLENGGNFLVSGSEIGWDLDRSTSSNDDRSFYENYLKASYVSDAPNNKSSEYYSASGISGTPFSDLSFNFDDGTHGTIDVDWPDAIVGKNGGTLGFQYTNVAISSGGAGVYYSGTFGVSSKKGKLVHLAVPFESIYPQETRDMVFAAIMDYFESSATAIAENPFQQPQDFKLLANYPNPFNPSTHIRFTLPSAGRVTINIYDNTGRLVFTAETNGLNGLNEFKWLGKNSHGDDAASGFYIYTVRFETDNNKIQSKNGRMILLR